MNISNFNPHDNHYDNIWKITYKRKWEGNNKVHRKESNTKEGSSGGSEDQKNGITYIEIK